MAHARPASSPYEGRRCGRRSFDGDGRRDLDGDGCTACRATGPAPRRQDPSAPPPLRRSPAALTGRPTAALTASLRPRRRRASARPPVVAATRRGTAPGLVTPALGAHSLSAAAFPARALEGKAGALRRPRQRPHGPGGRREPDDTTHLSSVRWTATKWHRPGGPGTAGRRTGRSAQRGRSDVAPSALSAGRRTWTRWPPGRNDHALTTVRRHGDLGPALPALHTGLRRRRPRRCLQRLTVAGVPGTHVEAAPARRRGDARRPTRTRPATTPATDGRPRRGRRDFGPGERARAELG